MKVLRKFFSRKKNIEARVVSDDAAPVQPMYAVDERIIFETRHRKQAGELKGRLWLVGAAFSLGFLMLAVRLFEVSFLMGEREVISPRLANSGVGQPRPIISDRNDRRLVMNTETSGAVIEMRDVWEIEETAEKVLTVLPSLDYDKLVQKMKSRKHVPLSNELSVTEKEALLALGLPGVKFTKGYKRAYPQRDLGAHLIGYTVPGRGGVAGIEKAIDELDFEGAVQSSVDIRVQQILEEELFATMTTFQAKAAWGVVMDVKTGEVIALASLPDYNPNDLAASDPSHWRNRAMYDVYELGSAFKIITAASALEAGATDLKRSYDVRHPIKVKNKTISDYKPKGGFMTLGQIVQYSSNIGMAQVALEMGREQQQAFLESLNLMSALQTELPEARTPILPSLWGDVETATISYGHGIAITPLQLTAAIGATVNGGQYVKPTFFKTDTPVESHQVFSPKVSAQMRVVLRQTITQGSGRRAETDGYYVIGKTATADKPSPTGGYLEDQRLSSFVGAFPGYDPKYVMLVSFDEPQPTEETFGYATAGYVAAPVFKRLVSRIAPLVGLRPVQDDLAFAKFMAPLREIEEVRLAMQDQGMVQIVPTTPEDDVASLLLELEP